jgi:hypothetical protein
MKKIRSLIEQVIKSRTKPEFASNEAALEAFESEMKALAQKHNLTPDELFLNAENSSKWDADLSHAHSLNRRIQMAKHLISKNKERKPNV